MDTFTAIVLGALAAGVLWVLGIGWLARKLPLADVIDKRRNENWAAQLMIEEHDLPQMLHAANEYRRNRGLPEVTLHELSTQVQADLREQIVVEARKQRRAKALNRNTPFERRGF